MKLTRLSACFSSQPTMKTNGTPMICQSCEKPSYVRSKLRFSALSVNELEDDLHKQIYKVMHDLLLFIVFVIVTVLFFSSGFQPNSFLKATNPFEKLKNVVRFLFICF